MHKNLERDHEVTFDKIFNQKIGNCVVSGVSTIVTNRYCHPQVFSSSKTTARITETSPCHS